MTATKARTPLVMSPWGHVALWLLAILAVPVLVISGLGALRAVSSGDSAPEANDSLYLLYLPDTALYFVGAALALVVLFGIWIRYWFLPSDLINLIEAEDGSTVERQGRVRTSIKGRIRDLWVLADLDHPVLSYLPSRAMRSGRGGRRIRRGLHPQHMLSVARVELVRVGDFSALPEVRFHASSESLRRTSSPSGYPVLDEALRDAASAITGVHAPITIEIRPDWLRVRVRGGSWLGGDFARRIRATIAFAERLVAALDDRFIPHDPGAATLLMEHGTIRLVQDRRFRTIRLDPARAVAEDRNDPV
jgi:hypothetical protein